MPDVSVLQCGIDLEWHRTHTESKADYGALERSINALQSIEGWEVEVFWIIPDDPAVLETFKQKVRDGPGEGRSWDAVLIGGGVRADFRFTALFEHIMNICREQAPKMKMLFNAGPNNEEAVRRGFPHLK